MESRVKEQVKEAESQISQAESQISQSEFWRAMADPTRRRLLELLRDEARTTGDLCQQFDLSRFAVMKHLGILEQAGLLEVRRVGRERWNHLNPELLHSNLGPWLRGREAGGEVQRRERVSAPQRWRPPQPSTFSIEED